MSKQQQNKETLDSWRCFQFQGSGQGAKADEKSREVSMRRNRIERVPQTVPDWRMCPAKDIPENAKLRSLQCTYPET